MKKIKEIVWNFLPFILPFVAKRRGMTSDMLEWLYVRHTKRHVRAAFVVRYIGELVFICNILTVCLGKQICRHNPEMLAVLIFGFFGIGAVLWFVWMALQRADDRYLEACVIVGQYIPQPGRLSQHDLQDGYDRALAGLNPHEQKEKRQRFIEAAGEFNNFCS